MEKCANCGTTVLFGGTKADGKKYCNEDCRAIALQNRVLASVPDDVIQDTIIEIHQGNCPMCDGPGPVDVRTSYKVWSLLIVSTHSSALQISCRSCGNSSKIKDIFFCGFLGWWSISGLIMTPIQIGRNIFGILSAPNPAPSPMLAEVVRGSIAEDVYDPGPDNFYVPPQNEVPLLGPSANSDENDT